MPARLSEARPFRATERKIGDPGRPAALPSRGDRPGPGSIRSTLPRMYAWQARGFHEGQAALALIWGYLGSVKRRQAAAALSAVTEQYRSGLYRARAPRRGRLPVHAVHDEVIHHGADATTLQRAWTAGFLDAEGSFGLVRGRTRKDGSAWFRIRASADQHGEIGTAADVLVRLHDVVGTGRIERHGAPDDYKWVVEGQPAIEQVLSVVGTAPQPGEAPTGGDRARKVHCAEASQGRCGALRSWPPLHRTRLSCRPAQTRLPWLREDHRPPAPGRSGHRASAFQERRASLHFLRINSGCGAAW